MRSQAKIHSPIISDRRIIAAALVLVLAVAVIYGQTGRHEFLAYDDDVYILNNPEVTEGLTWRGFAWAFEYHAANWHPLTWLSHMLDCQLFGLFAGGHHLMSAGLHAANAVLLLAVLRAMTGAFWRSAAVAALFALHPLRVESVAWAAERKDVLSSLFWILVMGAYLGYVRRPATRRYLAALGLFALGLAAKPMLVTLPFVLLLLDWWPLGRAVVPPPILTAPHPFARETWRRLLLEKTPFLALALAAGLATLWGQTHRVSPMVDSDWSQRLANVAISYIDYLRSFAWPEYLAFLYPYPREGIALAAAGSAAAALAVTTAGALFFGRRRPYLLLGWFWYLGTLLPVIGFVQIGAQARSDRYTYLTMVGIAVALVWLARDLWPRRAASGRALGAACGVGITALAAAAYTYTGLWRDSITLFEHTLRVTTDNFVVLNNLGTALEKAGRYQDAARVLHEAARINPEHCNAPYNLGIVLYRLERYQQALEAFSGSLECYERKNARLEYLADTRLNLGNTLLRLGRPEEAERHFLMLLWIAPDHRGGRIGLIDARIRLGKTGARPTHGPETANTGTGSPLTRRASPGIASKDAEALDLQRRPEMR